MYHSLTIYKIDTVCTDGYVNDDEITIVSRILNCNVSRTNLQLDCLSVQRRSKKCVEMETPQYVLSKRIYTSIRPSDDVAGLPRLNSNISIYMTKEQPRNCLHLSYQSYICTLLWRICVFNITVCYCIIYLQSLLRGLYTISRIVSWNITVVFHPCHVVRCLCPVYNPTQCSGSCFIIDIFFY